MTKHPSPYNMTSGDAQWLVALNESLPNAPETSLTASLFERIIWILESIGNLHGWDTADVSFLTSDRGTALVQQWIHPEELPLVSRVAPELLQYWQSKKRCREGVPIIPTLKLEDNPKSITLDPYVCFRRRELRLARKTRRSDAMSLGKLKRLRSHFEDVIGLVSQIIDRDRLKRDALRLEASIYSHTLQL